MKQLKLLATIALGLTIAGCSGDDSSTDDSNTTVPTTSVGGTAEDDGTADSGPGDTGPGDTGPGDTGDTGPGDTGPADSSGGGGSGFCGQICEAVADCVPAMGNEADYECVDGFCGFIGTIPDCDTATCDDLMTGVCSDVDGNSVCTTPCDDDTMCLAGFTECTGTDDAGASICAAIPCGGVAEGELCDIPMFGAIGTCTDGVCTCMGDDECTADGFACNA